MYLKTFKKMTCIVIIALNMLILSSCWDRKELKDLAIVGAIATDIEDKRVKLTFEIIKPKRIEGQSAIFEPAKHFESKGASVFDAIKNSSLKFDKELYLSHINAFVFSQEAVSKGLFNYLELFNRISESKRYIHVAVTKGKASDVLGIDGGIEDVPSASIESLFMHSELNGKSISSKLLDFLISYYEEGIEPITAILQKEVNPALEQKVDEYTKNSVENKSGYILTSEGAAVFKDDFLVGYLDGIEARSYNFVTGKLRGGAIVSDAPQGDGINTLEIKSASSNKAIKITNGALDITVKIKISGFLYEETSRESIGTYAPGKKTETILKIEKSISDVIKSEIENTIIKVQSFKSDVFGIGQVIHRKHPDEWQKLKQNWNEIFAKQKIHVDVTTTIEKVGVSNRQLKVKE